LTSLAGRRRFRGNVRRHLTGVDRGDLGFLWWTSFVLSIVSVCAILITGRYPQRSSTST
jgi:hypothetical protein